MVVQLVVATGNRAGQVVPVSTEKFIIGRAADCHLKPSSELISRYHCAILVGNEVLVRDLGSRNGVLLNGEKISAERKLNNGDKLAVGPLEFYVRIASNDDASAEMPPGDPNVYWSQRAEEDEGKGGTCGEAPTLLMGDLKSSHQGTEQP
jgi:pSer/pThr/pTyr-binding forkhead associated (FHA) protein